MLSYLGATLKLSVRMYKRLRHLLLSLPAPAHFIAKIPCSVESRFIPRARLQPEGTLRNLINRRHSSRASSQQPRIVAIQLQYQFFIRAHQPLLTQSCLSVLTCCKIGAYRKRVRTYRRRKISALPRCQRDVLTLLPEKYYRPPHSVFRSLNYRRYLLKLPM